MSINIAFELHIEIGKRTIF